MTTYKSKLSLYKKNTVVGFENRLFDDRARRPAGRPGGGKTFDGNERASQ